MLYIEYKELVIQDYRKKKTARSLPFDISQPSPAKLRNECLTVCRKRYDKTDERTLEAFFGQGVDEPSWLRLIGQCDIDRFRPLVNFLKNPAINPDIKIVELLAWLIDFQPRPFDKAEKYDVNTLIDSGIGPVESKRDDKIVSETQTGQLDQNEGIASSGEGTSRKVPLGYKGPTLNIRTAVVAVIILALAGNSIYLARTNKSIRIVPAGPQVCMFWADDHYEVISCNQKHRDTLIVALDSELLVHFKKIARPDTITDKAIGYVWYIRYRGKYEFYTHEGYHPIEPLLRLRPITGYIIRNHVHAE